MLKILTGVREKWTGRGNGYRMPSLILRRSVQPSEGEEGFSKEFLLLLLNEFFPCTPPQEKKKRKRERKWAVTFTDNHLLCFRHQAACRLRSEVLALTVCTLQWAVLAQL